MIKHYITKYTENGKRYAESWLQINLFRNELYDLCEAMEISPTELRERYEPRMPV